MPVPGAPHPLTWVKGRGFCPQCSYRRSTEVAMLRTAHGVLRVLLRAGYRRVDGKWMAPSRRDPDQPRRRPYRLLRGQMPAEELADARGRLYVSPDESRQHAPGRQRAVIELHAYGMTHACEASIAARSLDVPRPAYAPIDPLVLHRTALSEPIPCFNCGTFVCIGAGVFAP